MAYLQEVPKPFHIMDGVLLRCLPGYAPGWVEFEREEVIPGVEVVYHLSQDELGDLGDVRISKADDQLTVLHFGDPPRVQVDADKLKETYAQLKHEHPNWDTARVTIEAQRQEREEADALWRRRKDHHRKVIQALNSRMAEDPAMRVKRDRQEKLDDELPRRARGVFATHRKPTHEVDKGRGLPHSGCGGGEGSLSNQSGQSGQGGPGISQISDGFPPQSAIHRKALAFPTLKGSIAAFRGVAGLVVETFPGG